MTARLALAISLLVFVALLVSWQMLERSLSGSLVAVVPQSEKWPDCEYSPAKPTFDALGPQERVRQEQCDLLTCVTTEVTVRNTALRLHEPETVKEC